MGPPHQAEWARHGRNSGSGHQDNGRGRFPELDGLQVGQDLAARIRASGPPEHRDRGTWELGTCGRGGPMRRDGKPAPRAGPATNHPLEVVHAGLASSVDCAQVGVAEAFGEWGPPGGSSRSLRTLGACPGGPGARHRGPKHLTDVVDHGPTRRSHKRREHWFSNGRALGLGFRPGATRAAASPNSRMWGVVDLQGCLLDAAQHVVQGIGACLPQRPPQGQRGQRGRPLYTSAAAGE